MKEKLNIQALKKALSSGKRPDEIAKEFHIREDDVKELKNLKGEALEARITKGFVGW